MEGESPMPDAVLIYDVINEHPWMTGQVPTFTANSASNVQDLRLVHSNEPADRAERAER